MLETTHTLHKSGGTHQVLADRLLQLANDSDRVGLHYEATALARMAASVLQGRRVVVRDA